MLLLRQTGHGRFLVEDLQDPLPELDAAGGEDPLLSPGDRRGGAAFDQPLTLELAGQYQNSLAESSRELRIPIAGIQASAETLLRANPSRPTRKELIQQIQRQSPGRGRAQIGALQRDFAGIQQIPITVQNQAVTCAAFVGGGLIESRLATC